MAVKPKRQNKKANIPKKLLQKKSNRFNAVFALLIVAVIALLGFIILSSQAATLTSGVKPVTPYTSFYWQLSGITKENALDAEPNPKKIYDIDLFDNDTNLIGRLKAKGISVICYFSAGTSEDWRSDFSQFKAADKGNPLDDWAGELQLDTRSANVRRVMTERLNLAKSKGCDGVEPDNIDSYTNNPGFPLTANTATDYVGFLINEAHSRNLSIGMKNMGDLVSKNLPNGKKLYEGFDWALVEQCYQYNECDAFTPFTSSGKAVFIVEYQGKTDTWASSNQCKDAAKNNFDTYRMNLALDGKTRVPCRTGVGQTTTVSPTSTSTITPTTTITPTSTTTPSNTVTPTPSVTPGTCNPGMKKC
jgi:hypothetical protein